MISFLVHDDRADRRELRSHSAPFVLGAQAAGVAVLALAFVVAITRVSVRRPAPQPEAAATPPPGTPTDPPQQPEDPEDQ